MSRVRPVTGALGGMLTGSIAFVLTGVLTGAPAFAAERSNAVAPETAWFQSAGALWIGAGLLFVALVTGIAMALAPRQTTSQIAGSSLKGVRNGRTLTSLSQQATGFAERSLARNERGTRLNVVLERAGVAIRPSEFAVLVATAVFCVFAGALLMTNLIVAVIAAALVPIVFRSGLTVLSQRRAAAFADQLEQTLPLMAGSLRAGFGIMQALDAVARESESPTADEFHRLVVETRLGRDLTDSMVALANRVDSEDFHWVVQAIEIHREVGGDLAEVLDNVFATIRDRNRIRRQIKALSAEGRFSALVLLILPIAMFGVVTVLNPDYVAELTQSSLGVGMLVAAAGLMVAGALWLKRITRLVF